MKKRNRTFLAGAILALALLALLAAAPAVRAELNALGVDRWVVAGGGVNISLGGNYTLIGTAGQPAAYRLQGGNYSVQSGFWEGGTQEVKNFLPSVMR